MCVKWGIRPPNGHPNSENDDQGTECGTFLLQNHCWYPERSHFRWYMSKSYREIKCDMFIYVLCLRLRFQKWTTLKPFQLLFLVRKLSTCRSFPVFLPSKSRVASNQPNRCTIMVLISYCGGYLGYAPLTARRAKRHRWRARNPGTHLSMKSGKPGNMKSPIQWDLVYQWIE